MKQQPFADELRASLQAPPQAHWSEDEMARRRAANLKLAWVLAGVVLVVFAIALIKFRPL